MTKITKQTKKSNKDLVNEKGTRIQHLLDLLDTWNSGLFILENSILNTQYTREQMQIYAGNLKIAIKLLEHYINNMSEYGLKLGNLREEVDNIEKYDTK